MTRPSDVWGQGHVQGEGTSDCHAFLTRKWHFVSHLSRGSPQVGSWILESQSESCSLMSLEKGKWYVVGFLGILSRVIVDHWCCVFCGEGSISIHLLYLFLTQFSVYALCVCMLSHFSCIWLLATLRTLAFQAPLSWDPPGKNTGMSCHALLQGTFLTQG